MTLDSIQLPSRFLSGHVCQAYNEAAFRHFLAVERTRAQRSQRLLYLILVSIRQHSDRRTSLSDTTAMALLRGIGASVREVDFVGWFRENRVAAAVLAQGAKPPDGDAAAFITRRMVTELKKRLSNTDACNLRVRVVRLGGRVGI